MNFAIGQLHYKDYEHFLQTPSTTMKQNKSVLATYFSFFYNLSRFFSWSAWLFSNSYNNHDLFDNFRKHQFSCIKDKLQLEHIQRIFLKFNSCKEICDTYRQDLNSIQAALLLQTMLFNPTKELASIETQIKVTEQINEVSSIETQDQIEVTEQINKVSLIETQDQIEVTEQINKVSSIETQDQIEVTAQTNEVSLIETQDQIEVTAQTNEVSLIETQDQIEITDQINKESIEVADQNVNVAQNSDYVCDNKYEEDTDSNTATIDDSEKKQAHNTSSWSKKLNYGASKTGRVAIGFMSGLTANLGIMGFLSSAATVSPALATTLALPVAVGVGVTTTGLAAAAVMCTTAVAVSTSSAVVMVELCRGKSIMKSFKNGICAPKKVFNIIWTVTTSSVLDKNNKL